MAKTSKTVPQQPDSATKPTIPGWSTKYDYVLDWIKESSEARRAQNQYVERAVKAYQGEPAKNNYKKSIKAYVQAVYKHDATRSKEIEAACSDVPDKNSMAVHDAVETVVSMAMGGVGQYEFGPYDPDMTGDSDLVDRLASAAKHFYNKEKVDAVVPQFIRNAVLAGDAWLHLKNKKDRKVITILESSQMITDPKRFKTTQERFIGFHQRESFKAVKERTRKAAGGGYVLKTLNAAEIYVTQVVQELNSVLQKDSTSQFLHDELRQDLDLFYKPIITRIEDRKNDNPEYLYNGDEIEISYLYDKLNDMYFEVINRRYVIVAKAHNLKTNVKCTYYDAKGEQHIKEKEVRLDDPFVELPYIKTFWNTYPMSPLFLVLDDFDDLCAMESVLFHNLSIMAPITFVGQSSDAEKVSRIASVAGEVVEGLPQTFGVLDKTHNIEPLVVGIKRTEEKIKRVMKAVDPFELQAMIGDRATAKEVVSASGQVAQGINPFLANIETAMATLGEKFMKMEIIFGDNSKPYSFVHNGKYGEVSAEDMAHEYEVTAKMVSSIKLEQEANSRKALELEGYLAGAEGIDKKKFHGTMIPIILTPLVNRQQAEDMVLPEYRQMPDEVIAAIKRKAEAEAAKDPIDKLDLSGYGDDELEQLALQYGGMAQSGLPSDAMFGAAPPAAPAPGAPTDGLPNTAPQTVPVDPATGAPLTAPGNPQVTPQGAAPADPSIAAAMSNPEAGGLNFNDQSGQGYGF